ncbi:response regulator transcription factor [Abyssisolibacter fermentans]|uniref:response regulator transcription factor n=1 Tax=Abyssisolibacter fermentans TaxID=1766203 RepID=UPI003B8374AE
MILNEKILVVDDEVTLLEVVKDYLKKENYDVYTAISGSEAIKLFKTIEPDFIILDLMLPDISGEDVCRHVRKISAVPILMLTAKSSEDDRIEGLVLGADDYLTKPFSPRELVMRVKAILRRTKGNFNPSNNPSETVRFGAPQKEPSLLIDKNEHVVKKNGEVINITPNEYKILLTLAENPNRTFSRNQLINAALGYDYLGYDRTIDTHIKNLRQKIEDDYKDPQFIVTVYGVGYKFKGEKI